MVRCATCPAAAIAYAKSGAAAQNRVTVCRRDPVGNSVHANGRATRRPRIGLCQIAVAGNAVVARELPAGAAQLVPRLFRPVYVVVETKTRVAVGVGARHPLVSRMANRAAST